MYAGEISTAAHTSPVLCLAGTLGGHAGLSLWNTVLLVQMVRLILMASCASLAEWPVGCAYLLIQH